MSFADRFVFYFAATLLRSEAAFELSVATVDRAAAFAVDRIGRLPSFTRFGVTVITVTLGLCTWLVTGRSLADLGSVGQGRVVRMVTAVPLPGITEYVRLVRSLVVVAAYEDRHPLGIVAA